MKKRFLLKKLLINLFKVGQILFAAGVAMLFVSPIVGACSRFLGASLVQSVAVNRTANFYCLTFV